MDTVGGRGRVGEKKGREDGLTRRLMEGEE